MVCSYKNMAAKKSNVDGDGFQLVKKRRKRFVAPRSVTHAQRPPMQDHCYDGPAPQDIIEKITEYRESLQASQFFSELKDILRTASVPLYKEVVCYGIGHIGTSRIAQLQFALLLEMVGNDHQNPTIWVFDPVLHREELAAIKDCGCQLLPTNEVCKRTVSRPTLFYMPHCGQAMYNNLLWANWSVHHLTQMAIIGNTLSSYQERVPSKQLEIEATYIHRILGVCLEYPFPTSYPDTTIFNDLSLHTFPRERLESLSEREWTECPEPHIDSSDPEIIS